MIDTNALLSIAFSILAGFTNVVQIPPQALPGKVQDLRTYFVGGPRCPIDLYLVGSAGSRFSVRDGVVDTFVSASSYRESRRPGMFVNSQGAQLLNSNQALNLASNTIQKLAKRPNPTAKLTPRVTVPGAPEDHVPFYWIGWPRTNEWGMNSSPAFVEIDARNGTITYLTLRDRAFCDYAMAQVISNRVYTAPPRPPSVWQLQFQAPGVRVKPCPTTNEVLSAIGSWLWLCQRLGVDPGAQTNLDSVFWPKTVVYTNEEISRAAAVCQVNFSNHACFESINGVVFSLFASNACFFGFYQQMSPEDLAQFNGKIIKRWEDLAKDLERVLVEKVGIPRALLEPFSPELDVRIAPTEGRSIKRVVVGWRNWPRNAHRFVDVSETANALSVEFDLETGELKWISFEDPRFIGALRLAQSRSQ